MSTDYTPDQLADLLGITKAVVMRQVRAKAWPHQRYSAHSIRFTQAQVQQIRDLAAVDPDTKPATTGARFDRVGRAS